MPDYTVLGVNNPQPSIRTGFDYPQGYPSPVARALQGLGAGIQDVGQSIEAQRKRAEAEAQQRQKFALDSQLLQGESQWNDYQDQSEASTSAATTGTGPRGPEAIWGGQQEPTSPAGHTQNAIGAYDVWARGFLKTIPDALKPEYDLKLVRQRQEIIKRGKVFEQGEGDKYTALQLDKNQNVLLDRLSKNPDDLPNILKEADSQINNAPMSKWTPAERAIQREQMRERFQGVYAAVKHGNNPEAFRQAAGITPAATSQDALGLVRHFEGFRSGAYWDANHYRVGYGSDTTTTADGTVINVTKGTQVSQEAADRDLARRVRHIEAENKATVGEAWGRLDQSTRAALTSVAYNYGSLPDRLLPAIRSGDKAQIASAVNALGRDNGGVNAGRRAQEASVILGTGQVLAGGQGGPSTNVIGDNIDPNLSSLPFEKRWNIYQQNLADTKAAIKGPLEDYLSYVRNGNPDAPVPANADPSVLGGDDAVKGQAAIESARSFGRDMAAVKWATPADVNQMVEGRVAERNATPENFRENDQNVSQLVTAINQRNAELAKAPADYALNEPTVKAAYDKFHAAQEADKPAALQAYADATLGLQQRLGLPSGAQRLLPVQAAAQIAQSFDEQVGGGQNAAAVMRNLAAQWGPLWPHVLHEIGKDLPDVALAVSVMDHPNQIRAAEELAEAGKAGPDALEKTLPSSVEVKRDIDKPLADQMEAFKSTLIHNPGWERTYLAMSSAVRLLALSRINAGADPGSAISTAYNDVLGKSYTIEGTMRIPIEQDAGTIETGARSLLNHIQDIPLDTPAWHSGISTNDAREAYLTALKSQGYWVTSDDETGLTLFDGNNTAVTWGGKPYTLPWDYFPKEVSNEWGKYGEALKGKSMFRTLIDRVLP